jgi:hypothetical protein
MMTQADMAGSQKKANWTKEIATMSTKETVKKRK